MESTKDIIENLRGLIDGDEGSPDFPTCLHAEGDKNSITWEEYICLTNYCLNRLDNHPSAQQVFKELVKLSQSLQPTQDASNLEQKNTDLEQEIADLKRHLQELQKHYDELKNSLPEAKETRKIIDENQATIADLRQKLSAQPRNVNHVSAEHINRALSQISNEQIKNIFSALTRDGFAVGTGVAGTIMLSVGASITEAGLLGTSAALALPAIVKVMNKIFSTAKKTCSSRTEIEGSEYLNSTVEAADTAEVTRNEAKRATEANAAIQLKANQEEEMLVNMISIWTETIDLSSHDNVCGLMAETNAIFDGQNCEDVTLDLIDSGKYSFAAEIILTGEPRKDDVPFAGDTINVDIEGTVFHDVVTDQWKIDNEYEVSAELEDYSS